MAVKDFFQGTIKTAVAIFLALFAVVIVIWLFNFAANQIEERRAKPYEEVKVWSKDLSSALGMKFSLKTKLVNGKLLARLDAEGNPPFLSDPAMFAKNADKGFLVQFVDTDGFKVWEKPVTMSEMSQIILDGNSIGGYKANFEGFMSTDSYARIDNIHILWTLTTENPRNQNQEDAPTLLDHCAPGLSKAERLRRLKTKGELREVGYETFEAGQHSVTFHGASLISCN